VGYFEVSKAFKIYILGQHHIEISRDVTFDEDAALKKSKICQLEEVYEEEPRIPNTAMREVPKAAKTERQVITSPDEELLEDHCLHPFHHLGEQISGAYMPSWVLLSMTAVEERVRKRKKQNYKQELN
jgi:hypothetical protein